MARSTGPILATGLITFGRSFIIDGEEPQWRVIAGTAVAAMLFAGAEKALPDVIPPLAWLTLVTVTFVRLQPNRPAPAEALADFLSPIR